FLLFLMFFSTPIFAQISDAVLQSHIERVGMNVISMGDPIQVQEKTCYQKRMIEIYDLIKQLIYITAVFFILIMGVRIFLGDKIKPIQTVLFIGLALGFIEIFPNLLFMFTEKDFRDEECPVIELNREMIQKQFSFNEKLKEAVKNRQKVEELEKAKETVENIWRRTRTQNANSN
ncbi:MAG: hypothetical protein ACTSXL_01845, partial [Alphaproteobacteria bacterium]